MTEVEVHMATYSRRQVAYTTGSTNSIMTVVEVRELMTLVLCMCSHTVDYIDIYLYIRVTNPALCKFYNKLVARSVCCSLRLAPTMIIIILVMMCIGYVCCHADSRNEFVQHCCSRPTVMITLQVVNKEAVIVICI